MRWFIGTLIAVNLAILLWGSLGGDEERNGELAAPDVGSIRLLGEPAVSPDPQAVPIPAPPRADTVAGSQPTEVAPPAPGGDAAVAPAAARAAPQVQPLTEPQPAPAAAVADAAPAESPSAEAAPVVEAPEPQFVPEPEAMPLAPSQFCVSVGPFADADAAKATRDFLAARGRVDSHEQPGEMRVGYWVLVPPQPSRDAANAIAARIKSKGITDFWVVGKGPVKNGISLGVFSQRDNADAFVKRAKAKGIEVEMRDKTKPVTQYWLDYRGTKPVVPSDLADRAPADVRIDAQDCPRAAPRG